MRRLILYRVVQCCICYCILNTVAQAQTPINSENFTVKEGLSENVVHCLLQDKKGFLWIGTHEGLNRYDGYEFKKFLYDKNDKTSLPNSPIEDLYDDNDNLFVSTTSGLIKMDILTGKFASANIHIPDFIGMANRSLRGNFNSFNFGIDPFWIYDKKNNPDSVLLKKHILSYPGSLAFYYDAFKSLWILQQDKLLLIDEKGKEKIILTGFFINHKESRLFNWLINDAGGNIWLRTPGKMFCIDKKTLRVKVVVDQAQLKELSIENIQALLLDRSGVLWVGSFYGLKKINLLQQKFHHLIKNDNESGLVSNFVLGLNIYDGNKLAVQHYFADSFYTEVELPLIAARHYKIEEKKVEKLLEEVLIRNSNRAGMELRNNQIQKLKDLKYDWKNFRYAYTDRDGVIWSFYNISWLVNFQDNRMIKLNGGAEYLCDDNEFLWVATTKQGLIRHHKTNGQIKNYQIDKSSRASISSNDLICLVQDPKENIWIGTRGGGLNYFDKTKETFTSYTQANGLSNNTIYCMVMDDENNLWMGTAQGLSYFNTESKTFQNFYTTDGLVNTEFNRWSAVKDAEGNLYFGGMHGIDYFKPGDVLSQKNNDLVVQLTDFKTGNYSQTLQEDTRLSHKQNYISFEFAAMDFGNPKATQYKYMLEGANNDWIDNGHNHTATFAALPPGEYTFRVKGTTQNGIWSNDVSFPFTINTPWWQTKWFYALCGLLVVSALYSIYRFRINQIRKLYLVRSKISQDLHDEVGATLTSISFLSEVANKQTTGENEGATQTLNKIGEYSREMIGEMNDIVWAINPSNDKFEKIADRIINFALPLLSARNIQFDFYADTQMKHVSLNMQQRKNLYLIFKEAVSNAAKYADCNKVKVDITRENNHVRLDIMDNGKGFSETEIIPGNGLTNIRYRAKEVKATVRITSQLGEGTTISLSMPITQNT